MRAPRRNDDFDERKPLPATVTRSARNSTAISGIIALSAAFAVTACSADPRPETFHVPAPRPYVYVPPAKINTALRDRIDSEDALVVGGEQLHAELLRRFYARHGYQPVWTTRHDEASQLVGAVLRAGDQGLDPDLFHAALLLHGGTLPPLDQELILSDAFLSYGEALAHGAVPVERRGGDEVLAPGPVDVATVLDSAMRSQDPASVIEALAPTTPTYLALRDVLQKYHAANAAPINLLHTVAVNLERQRWLPRELPADRVWVNAADQQLVLYRDGKPVFTTRIVVGEDIKRNQSPEFSATIDASFYNPPWVIPADIAKAEILPKLVHDPEYLTKNKMVMLDGGEVEQLPGPEAGLGYIMFDMPNKFDVYLHDTPDREIFALSNRRISHGCIRVQNPREFAALLTDQPLDAINQGIAKGDTTRNPLPEPVPVFVVYQTAFVDTKGVLQYRPDFYSRDAAIWQSLQAKPPVKTLTAHADTPADAS